MYTHYFGLTEEPFSIAANPRFLYMSANHREALAHLLYGIRSDSGFVLLTGEIGTGKTTVCRCLLEQLPDDTEVAFILNPRVSEVEMLSSICGELSIGLPEHSYSVKMLVDLINRHLLNRHADGRKTVVIIDEAQNLSADVLEQLRLLTNLETNERKLIRIILIGQPELVELLSRPELKQVEQRITARYHLKPLLRSEISAYVTHRLAVAGQRRAIFSPGVISKLYTKTGGIPRLINVICDRAMLGAYVKSQHKINRPILNKAAREVQGQPSQPGWYIPGSIIATLLLVVGATTTAALLYDDSQVLSKLLSLKAVDTTLGADSKPMLDIESEMTSEQTVEAETESESSQNPPRQKLIWPKQAIATDNASTAAQIAQFRQWGISLTNGATDPCKQAITQGLRCFSAIGNLGSLINLDRPAILTLVDYLGQQYQATLLNISGDQATLAFAHGIEKVSVDDLEMHWQGQYQLLWRVAPDGLAIFRPTDRGPGVTWLTKNLRAAGITSVQVKDNYDANVVEAVKAFQRNRGLLVDGIAGRQTLIHLRSVNDKSVPRLTSQSEG